MRTEPAYIRNFKALARANPTFEDLPTLEAEIYGANDRARAVMLAAVVETALEIFLRNKTRPSLNADDNRALFDYRGPAGDFASKILIGYAFNFYGPDTRSDLDLVRVIRNEFAHSRVPFNFTTPQVAAVCQELKAADAPGAFIPRAWHEAAGLTRDEIRERINKQHPRTRYIATCHVLSDRLLRNSGADAGLSGYMPPDMP